MNRYVSLVLLALGSLTHLAAQQTFTGKKIYYSASITGAPELDPHLGYNLVQYMIGQGANVLDEHVAGRTQQERFTVLARKTGKSFSEIESLCKTGTFIRHTDTTWVDEADYIIALVNAPSHGVGMELERALLKKQRGLPQSPILCLAHASNAAKVSPMIREISSQECPVFFFRSYTTLESAQALVDEFLTRIY